MTDPVPGIVTPGDAPRPARRDMMFLDGNARPALDPHDPRSLASTSTDDPVVIATDTTLGRRRTTRRSVVASVALTVVCLTALELVRSSVEQVLLDVATVVAVMPVVRLAVERARHNQGFIAIGSTGISIHRGRDDLHLAWVEIGQITLVTSVYHHKIRRPAERLSGRTRVQARTQIQLSPAAPGGFASHKGSALLHTIWSRPGKESPSVRPASATHMVPLRHRKLVDTDHVPTAVVLVDAAMRRFADGRYRGAVAERRSTPFFW